MDTFLSPFSWFILIFIGILLLIVAYYLFAIKNKKNEVTDCLPKGKPGAPGICPLCCTVLKKGEQLKTKVYPSDGSDKLCSIYGCPHCYPVMELDAERLCPVCKAPVPTDLYLVARLFDRSKTDKHVRILGCKKCRHA